MYNIETRNSIAPKGLERLSSSLFQISEEMSEPQGILVRSANMLEDTLPESLLAIARAGAGTNNIPVPQCTQKGIVVFNTPGANANAVKELVMGGLVLASRNVAGGIAWAQTLQDEGDKVPALVEKGKSRFAGPELENKTLGIVGLGAIGVKVANLATHLHMEVLGYDPFISINAAWSLSRGVKHCISLTDLVSSADYITLHLPVNEETRHIINAESLARMKQGVRILNFARAELVDNAALLTALKSGKVASYVTDFPSQELLGQPGVVCIPHLGASTPESEENCAVMAANQIKDYLVDGNIVNSVNLPNVVQPRNGGSRICVIHKNIKGILAGLTAVVNGADMNIDNMTNKSRGEYAYTLIDVAGAPHPEVAGKIGAMDGIVRVRVI